MAIGERIHFLRNLKGMTQKCLGMATGFDEKTADVRIAQYESGTRTPKENLVMVIAKALEVSPQALGVPNIDSYVGLMHTLFALEDVYGIKVGMLEDEVCLRLNKRRNDNDLNLVIMFNEWQQMEQKLSDKIITKEEYDNWRYNFKSNTTEQMK